MLMKKVSATDKFYRDLITSRPVIKNGKVHPIVSDSQAKIAKIGLYVLKGQEISIGILFLNRMREVDKQIFKNLL